MMNLPYRKQTLFGLPTTYQIRVQGRVSPDQADFLGGMTVRMEMTEAGTPVTVLDGTLSDQAALLGVMNGLYEMHFTVLSVVRLPSPPAGDPGASENDPIINRPGS
jgi:hypothetical protein